MGEEKKRTAREIIENYDGAADSIFHVIEPLVYRITFQ